jgi:type I restriction enzyme M protein
MRSAQKPGSTIDQEALQEESLGALQGLAGSAGNGRLRELLGWEEGPNEAVKASLLATGRREWKNAQGRTLSEVKR